MPQASTHDDEVAITKIVMIYNMDRTFLKVFIWTSSLHGLVELQRSTTLLSSFARSI